MSQQKNGGYVGVDLDEFDPESVQTCAGLRSRSSNIGLLQNQARRHSQKAWSTSSSQLHVRTKDFWPRAVPQTKAFLRESSDDLKSILGLEQHSWRHLIGRFYTLFGPILFIGGTAAVLPLITAHRLYQVSDACQPDSGFYVGYDEYDIWDVAGFFQITLGFGEFPFSTAKTIDVGWDVIVGRGGQALLVAISFIVYSKALVRSMESSPVSYGTFEAITLQNGSLTACLKLARDLLKNRTIQARATVIWMIISAIFVLAFPTIISAMTGYSVNIQSFVEVDNGNLVQYSNFTLIRYIVHDADRIHESLGKDFQVTTNGNVGGLREISQLDDFDHSDECTANYFPSANSNGTLDWSDAEKSPICEFYWRVSEYAYHHGFLGDDVETVFNYTGQLVNLTKPSLTITAYFWEEDWIKEDQSNHTDWWNWPFGYYWKSPSGDQPFHTFTDPVFTNGDFSYNLEQLNLNGRCQQAGTSYKWGFSFLVLFSFIVMFLVWCVGMYVLWLDAFLHSRFDRIGRSMGLQRAILDLAYCMHKDVDETGRDMLSNGELQSRIRRDLKGGSITYDMLDPKLLPLSRWAELRLRFPTWRRRLTAWRPQPAARWSKFRAADKKQWLKSRSKFWTAVLIGSLGFLAAVLAGTHTPLFSALLLVFGCIVILCIGEERKCRWLVFIIFAALAAAIWPIGPFVYLDKSHYALVWGQASAYNKLSWWYNQ